uniref:CPL3 ARM repeat domain-containing protein n=1 Tax=Rhizophora mucronata TaxID=61149 RepID=A0A2P2KVC0_RHIMU
MLVAGSDCLDWEGGEALVVMGKDEKTTTIKGEDVEEGEISDTASVEEISEEDFNKQEVKSPRQSKSKDAAARVWTMNDLYKFQMGGGYVSGLYSLAWAQAVQNKPLTELFVEVEQTDDNSKRSSGSPSSSVNSSSKEEKKVEKVVIDVSGDDDEMDCDEKEEGELEEGEIDLDSEIAEKDKDGVSSNVERNVCGSEIECKQMQKMDRKVDSICEALNSVTVLEAEKSFEAACSKLQSAVESLQEVVGEFEVPTKESLLQLSFTVIQTLHTVFSSMNYKLKGENKAIFSRLLSFLNSHDTPIFSPEQMKEICSMVSSVDSPNVLLSSRSGEKNKDNQTHIGLNKKDDDALANGAGYDITATNKLLPAAESLVCSKPNKSLEPPKQVVSSFKSRGVLLPLLDLHKVHDADSLPSPTREAMPSLPVNQVLPAGDGSSKTALPNPKSVPKTQNSKMHPYETDALKAVSSYQQKFGHSSFFMNDRLPSPTPSEESEDGDGDIGGEVSNSSNLGNTESLNPPILGQESSSASFLGNSGVQGVIPAKGAALVGSTTKGSAKSRDPRLRFISSDVNGPKVEPVGERLSSRKQKADEDPILDGTSLKRQRNGLDNSVAVRDVKPITGGSGLLEDMDVVASQTFSQNLLSENVGCDGKRIENGVPVCGKSTLNIDGNEHLPIVGTNATISGSEQVPPMGTNTTSLPDLLKDIAENPAMLMSLIKMGQQQRQKLAEPAKNAMPSSISNSILGAIPAVNVSSPQSTGILPRPAEVHQVASQIPKPVSSFCMVFMSVTKLYLDQLWSLCPLLKNGSSFMWIQLLVICVYFSELYHPYFSKSALFNQAHK